VARLFDEPVHAKSAQDSGHLAAVVSGKASAQRFVLHTADSEFPASQRQKERLILGVEKVEAAIRSRLLMNGSRDFVKLVDAIAGIVEGR